MPKRDQKLYIKDILDSIEAIKEFTKELDFENFRNDRMMYMPMFDTQHLQKTIVQPIVSYEKKHIT